MASLKDMPIERKVNAIIMVVAGIGVLGAALAVSIYDFRTFRTLAVRDAVATTELLGTSTEVALRQNDQGALQNALAALRVRQDIVGAAVYTDAGALLASYVRGPSVVSLLPKQPTPGHRFEKRDIEITSPVASGEQQLGLIYVRIDLATEYKRLYSAMLIHALFLGVTFVLASVLTRHFIQRFVSGPILRLAHTAREVTEKKDYTLRATKSVGCEIGQLTQDFNQMLAAIQEVNRQRDEFLSIAVHEIKTPVAAVKIGVQLLQRMTVAQQGLKLPDLLPRLNRQCDRINRLVTQVLEVTRLELDKTIFRQRPIDSRSLIAQVVRDMTGVSAMHEIVIVRNDPATIEVDPDRIEQVLTNLLHNAVRYSPGGDRIEVVSRREEAELIVSVRDHGIGIPSDKQSRIFECFYRAHAGTPYEQMGSTGVGLHLSRQFVIRHKGRMWFESEEGKGSTFHFSLPLMAASSDRLVLPSADGAPEPG